MNGSSDFLDSENFSYIHVFRYLQFSPSRFCWAAVQIEQCKFSLMEYSFDHETYLTKIEPSNYIISKYMTLLGVLRNCLMTLIVFIKT